VAGTAREFARDLQQFERKLVQAMAKATRSAADILLEEMRGLTGAVGTSLEDLARADHPYAKRHAPGSGPFADWITHIQKGDLHAGLVIGNEIITKAGIEVEIHSASSHTWYVVQDARASDAGRMRPRDFVSAAIINQFDRVTMILARAHANVHDTSEIQPFLPYVELIEHGGVSADLPEGL
jgi:hypothetical protein